MCKIGNIYCLNVIESEFLGFLLMVHLVYYGLNIAESK